MGLQLPLGQVTVLLGPDRTRRRIMAALDESTGRCADGHGSVAVRRLSPSPAEDVGSRLETLVGARDSGAAIVLVDRLTDGLPGTDRRAVLTAVRSVAGPGCAVLVDDADPVAALSYADVALRADAAGELSLEPVGGFDYLAS